MARPTRPAVPRSTGRPSARAIGAVLGLGIIGTLVPVVGWFVGVLLAARTDDWSVAERALAIVGPLAAMLGLAAVGVSVAGYPVQLSLVGVPIILSLSSAVGGIVLATRLVAHKRAAERRAAAAAPGTPPDRADGR